MSRSKKSSKKTVKKADAGAVIAAKSSSVSFPEISAIPGLTQNIRVTR